MIVSGRNLWFIAYWDRDKNTVGLYIPGKCKSVDGRSRFIPGIPKQFNDTNRQYKNMEEQLFISWVFTTNFFPVIPAESDHVNGNRLDNRR
jgi:hypothetical protein